MAGQGRLCPLCNESTGADFCPTHGVPTLVVSELEGAPAAIEIGTIIGGRYRIEHLLSQGGMGAVLVATQLGIGRTVVVKVVRTAKDALLGQLRRFYREAMAMSRLNHPNIVRVHEFGVDVPTRTPFLIMEHVDGRTLRDIVDRDGPLTERRAARLLSQVARALFEAHNQGVLHRDLKPRNIMVRELADGEELVKVLDFGLAKINEGDNPQPPLTLPGKTIGTPSYMSPEQVVSAEQDGRTDLYGLGCVLYMVLTGSAPFVGTDLIDTMRMHLNAPAPTLPDRLVDGQPPSELLKALLAKLLAKRRTERPDSAAEVARDLAVIAEGRIDLPKIQPLPQRGWEHDITTRPSLDGIAEDSDSDGVMTVPAGSTVLTELGQHTPDLVLALGSGIAPRDSDPNLPVMPPPPPRLTTDSSDSNVWTTVLPSSLEPGDAGLTPHSDVSTPSLEFDDGPTRAVGSGGAGGSMRSIEAIHLVVPAPPPRRPMVMYLGGAALVFAGTLLGFLYAPQGQTETNDAQEPDPAPLVTAVPSRPTSALLQSTPNGAAVYFASDLLGRTPIEVKLPEDNAERHLSLELTGFENTSVILHSDSPAVILVSLRKTTEPEPKKSKPHVKKKKKKESEEEDEEEVPVW